MARYMEIASDLRKEIEGIMELVPVTCPECDRMSIAQKIGYAVNLAVRCAPRPVQSTVRYNIVREAVGKWCKVSMTEEVDERTQKTYHKIHIEPRS